MFQKMIKRLNPSSTPQYQPIPGREPEMTLMRSGGYGFKQDELTQLYSLLILGNENGSFYEGADEMQTRHADVLRALVQRDPMATIDLIVEVSTKNIAIKNAYPVFALAVVATLATGDARKRAFDVMPQVARTGSDFLAFVGALFALGKGWGRSTARGVASWYLGKDSKQLAYQMLKYHNRSGVSHADVWRQAHVLAHADKAASARMEKLANWLKTGDALPLADVEGFEQIVAYETILTAHDEGEVESLVTQHRFTHEMVPNEWKKSARVWAALAADMPYAALIRNLNKLSAVGLLGEKHFKAGIVAKLTDKDAIVKSRVHPINILVAQKQFAAGRGDKGSLTWTPVPAVIDALDEAFYIAIQAQALREANILMVADVSGSMGGHLAVKHVALHAASAAMILTAMHRYANVDVLAVDTGVHFPNLSKRQRLDDAHRTLAKFGGGGTDLSKAFQHLAENRRAYDGLIVLTDNESWAGYHQHTSQAWAKYREKVAPNARALFVQMVANGYTVADPKDATVRSATGFDGSIFRQFDLMLDGVI